MRLLETVDADEVSPVRRGANRKGLVLKEDGMSEDAEIADIMAIPWEREGAMIDEIRKGGADETVVKGAVAAMRLLNGVVDELPDELREVVEKLGTELYARQNPKLNTGDASDVPGHDGELTGSGSGAAKDGSGSSSGGTSGSGRDGELTGSGSYPELNKDAKDKEPDDDEDDDVAKAAYDEELEKADRTFSASTRRGYAKRGVALPDGSFPIPDRDALGRAIRSIGRGKNNSKGRIRAHIVSRARALGAAGMLPDDWKVSKADDGLVLPDGWDLQLLKGEEGDTIVVPSGFAERIKKAFRKSQDKRPQAAANDVPDDNDGDPDENDNDDTIAKGGPVEAHEVPIQKADGTWDLSGVPDATRPFYETVLKAQAETAEKLEKAETELAETREGLRTAEIIAKAEKEFAHIGARDDVVAVLKSASEKLDAEGYEKLVTLLTASDERIAKSSLMDEMGRSSFESAPAGDAWDKIEKAADDLVQKADTSLSRAQAIDRVLKTAEGKRLYGEYLAETGVGRVS